MGQRTLCIDPLTALNGLPYQKHLVTYSKAVTRIYYVSSKVVVTRYSSSQHATPLLELTCRMGSHSVTYQPAEVTFQPLPRPKLVLDLATPEGCKAELT